MRGNAFLGFAARQGEAQSEDGATRRSVRDRNRSPVRSHGLPDNRQTESRALKLRSPSAPKTIEYAFSICGWDARSSIGYAYGSFWINPHKNFRPGGRMNNRIFNQVSNRIGDRVRVSFGMYWNVGPLECNRSLSRQYPGSD